MTQVILVDEHDNPIWLEEKLRAHELGLLHRAFSIFVFNKDWKLLLQRRALDKYHSWWLWTNTVCSHPKPDEDIIDGCKTRMVEEIWFSVNISEIFSFVYRSDYENWLSEHEFDHVFVGYYDHDPIPNPEEVCEFTWKTLEEIRDDIIINSHHYTTWFTKIMTHQEHFDLLKKHSVCQS